MAAHKRKLKDDDGEAYKDAVYSQTINELAGKCNEFRCAINIINKNSKYLIPENIDILYQKLFDDVLDQLLTCYDTGAIHLAMRGLKDGLNIKRGFLKR